MRQKSKLDVLILIKYKSLSGVLIALTVIISSCSPVYFPNMVNSPLFTDKAEFTATTAIGNTGYNAQMAYAPINHFGLIANGSINSVSYPKFYTYDVGAGYFGKLPEEINSTYEFYLGEGKGQTQNVQGNLFADPLEDATYTHLFAQSGIGFENRYFAGGIAIRLSYLDMNIFNHSSLITNRY